MESDWQEIQRVMALGPRQLNLTGHVKPVLAFDTNAELLWQGTDQGYVCSYSGSDLRKYTSFRGHIAHNAQDQVVKSIQFNERGLVSLAPKSLHFATRGGIAQWNLLDDRFQALSCMAYTSRGTSELLVAGTQGQMFTVNMDRGTINSEILTDEGITIMKRSSRYVVCGTTSGSARLLDMGSFNVVKEFQTLHTGAILDLDTHENLLITCGYSIRHNSPMLDPLVKIYDLRMMRALPPFQFPGASFLRMHPKMSAVAVVASSAGQFQIADLMNPAGVRLYHVPTNTYFHALDLSPTGDFLAFIDGEGVLALWSQPGKSRFSEVGAPVDWPEPPSRLTQTITNDTPLSTIGMPYYQEELLSVWPHHLTFDIPKLPQRIDADTLAVASQSGYAPYHRRLPRNYVEKARNSDNSGIVPAPKFLSQQARSKASRSPEGGEAEDKLLYGDDSKRQFEVPPMYKKLEIKYSRFGVEDFDFVFYNKTKYSGLETNIPNSYMNPLLQLYRFTPRLRNFALTHTAGWCPKEDCNICQMGFLFDMLEKANGLNSQATNFLKNLSSLPTAARMGVLEEESSSTGTLSVMMQNLNRFLLDQAILDEKNAWPHNHHQAELHLPNIVMIKATKSQRCMVCHKETRPIGDTVTSDLVYSKPANNKPPQTFATTVRQSIQLETTQKGWCDKCRRYQNQASRKSIAKVPDVLTFNVSTQDKNMGIAKEHWSTPGWLPDQIAISLNNKHLNVWQGDEVQVLSSRRMDHKLYDLIGVVVEVREDDDRRKHMVSFINVALSSETPYDGQPNWHLFNDFLVKPVSREEALDFSPKWKMPSVLCFQLRSDRSTLDNSWVRMINPSILYPNNSFLGVDCRLEPEVTPLDKISNELPRDGALVALDAEFVSLKSEETEVKADGSRVIVTPSRLGLARVSVLRGQGELEGVPFLDDYIATKEPVVDFLTEFSGIHPGDLNPSMSKHALVSLKVAYKRLWVLLNLGCVFVGHGLLKDFRIINIHVPKAQVIDTVDLYILRSSQRKLSLRFLAWVILSDQIQTETHDSIEDSRTALRLYKKYLEYRDAGILEEIFDRIYTEGLRLGFKPPTANGTNGPTVAAGRLHQLAMSDSLPRSETTTPQPRIVVEQ